MSRETFKPSTITRCVAAAEKVGRRIATVVLDANGALTLTYETGAEGSDKPLDLVAMMQGGDGPKKGRSRAD